MFHLLQPFISRYGRTLAKPHFDIAGTTLVWNHFPDSSKVVSFIVVQLQRALVYGHLVTHVADL